MELNTLNITELKDTLNRIIDNNMSFTNKQKKSAVEVVGEAGIGKTSVILQLAEERNMDIVKLNLSQLEELGDMVGFPTKEYKLHKDGEFNWAPDDIITYYMNLGWEATGESRMGYALPSWLPKNKNPNGGILLLDDYSRADPRFITATMELIDRGEYISWSLPDNWSIVLSSNPDNGDYNVSSMDNAQKSRYISFALDFDVNVWAKWAEKEKIDDRCINFLLTYPEILKKEGNVQKINARSMVTFFNTISGFKDFSDPKTLAFILNIAKGCFTSSDNIVGNLFTQFIINKLDKLPTPEEILKKKWDTMKTEMFNVIYDNGVYRADIASTLSIRFCNYIDVYFNEKGSKTDMVCDRIIELIDEPTLLLTEDLIFNLIKTLRANHPSRTNKLMLNMKIAKKVL